jgi:hypothetical protein
METPPAFASGEGWLFVAPHRIAWRFLDRVPEISSKPALGNPVRVINVVAPEDPGSQS